jgi:uncharacterized repeat protein (TIGR01451 family)
MAGGSMKNSALAGRWFGALLAILYLCGTAWADTPVALYESFAGNLSFVGTQKTLRTQPNTTNPCSITTGTTQASLSGIPASATIRKAYLYWAGSGSNDYTVTFEGASVTASRQYTATWSGNNFFNGVADVTSQVNTKRNGTYSLSGLSVNNSYTYCSNETVLGGWALLVIYADASETFRVLNLYEGFQAYQYTSITLNPSNFTTPTPLGSATGKHGHITWEGDPTLSGGSEDLVFNTYELTDAINPSHNQFNSASNITSPADTASYGVDFDSYTVASPVIGPGQTSAETVYSSGQDLVFLSAEIIAMPNIPVADLALGMTLSGSLVQGQNAAYALTVSNNGPNEESGPIVVSDTLPGGLSFVSGSGTGWSCSASGQTVTCTHAGPLASGATLDTLTLTVAVSSSVTGSLTNTASVDGAMFDNVAGNDTASVSATVTEQHCTTSNVGTDVLVVCTGDGSISIPTGVTSVRYLVVGGGGGGGGIPSGTADGAGGGGAGGVLSGSALSVTAGTTYTVTVGAGGTAGTGSTKGGTGGSSTFSTLTALGGGGGAWVGNDTGTSGNNGASGGGGSDSNDGGTGSQGNDGGDGNNNDGGGGGGGAGAAGADGTNTTGGNGGVGVSNDITGSATYYGGGGGGGADDGGSGGSGGNGGGGSAPTGRGAGNPGTANTGGGGGGATGSTFGSSASGGNGGSGIVIIRYSAPVTWPQQCEGFESGLGGWTVDNTGGADPDYGTAVIDTAHAQSGAQSLLMSRDWVRVTMNSSINTANATGSIYFGYARGLGGDYPEPGDDLQVEYQKSDGTWATLTTLSGVSVSDTGFLTYSAALPTDAKHNSFKLRLTLLRGSGDASNNFDQWNIDNVCVPISLIAVDHYELSLPTKGVTCLAAPVTVTACADTTSPCTNKTTTIQGSTATLAASAGTLGSSTVTFDANGTASTTLSYADATDGATATVTLSNELTTATNPRKCCPDGVSCTVANSCSITFNTTGFVFSETAGGSVLTVPTQTAGLDSSTYYLRAVKTNTTTKACESALSGTSSVNLAFQCSDPTTCSSGTGPTCGSGNGYFCLTPYSGTTAQTPVPLAGNPSSDVTSYSAVNLVFDSNGNAPFIFNYRDVGKIVLHAAKPAGGTLLTTLTGATNAFVVKPYSLALSGIKCTTANAATCGAGALAMTTPGDNPGAEDAAGVTFIRAGDPFTVTATAQAYGGTTTPNFGRESTPEWVKLTPATDSSFNPSVDRSVAGSMTAGSATLTVSSTSGYLVGDRIRVAGAGTSGADLITTVSAVASATELTLAATAGTTVSAVAVHYMFPAFSGGTATGTNFTWGEVGIITLTPSVGDGNYLGVGSITGAESGKVGRFYPHHFGVTGSVVTRSDLQTSVGLGTQFTYMGEPMKLTLTLTAYNKAEGVTQNYVGDFSKLSASALGTTIGNWTCASGTQCMGLAAASGANLTARLSLDTASPSADPTNTTTLGGSTLGWGNGISYFTLYPVFNRCTASTCATASPDGPYKILKLGAKPLDSDGVTLPPRLSSDTAHCVNLDVSTGNESSVCDPGTTETNLRRKLLETDLRFGRLWLGNAYGSEQRGLAVPYETQYWNGFAFVRNADDGLTPFGLGNVSLSSNMTTATLTNLAAGAGTINLSAPLVGGVYVQGTVDVYVNLGSTGSPANCANHAVGTTADKTYLSGKWCGTAYDRDPVARATFGIQAGRKGPIYIRENY